MYLEIMQDHYSESPRDWDNISEMHCIHGRYDLGDTQLDMNEADSWEEQEQLLKSKYDIAIIKPLYLYDHSGITIANRPFTCMWDSGQVGFQFITKQSIREAYNIKRVTDRYIKQVEQIMDSEIEIYDMYIRGNVFEYGIYSDNDEDIGSIESCGGFYLCDSVEDMINDMKQSTEPIYHNLFDNFDTDDIKY